MKIYGDVLAAVNFTVTLLILQLCGRILGIRPGRAVKYISGALGAAAAFIIFVPIHSVADVSVTVRIAEMTATKEELLNSIKEIDGVNSVVLS